MAKLLGPLWTGKHKHRVFLRLLQLLLAATGLLEEHVLPLLWYWLNLRVKKVLIFCAYQAATRLVQVTLFLMWNEIFNGIGLKLLPTKAAPIVLLNISNFLSFIGLWVKYFGTKQHVLNWIQYKALKAAYLNRRPVLEKGCAQIWIEQHNSFRWLHAKLWNNVWHDSELIGNDCNQSLQPHC